MKIINLYPQIFKAKIESPTCCWAEGANKRCPGVASKARLKQSCQTAVSEWQVSPSLHKGVLQR